ncbi:hypothetical protein [Francisella philomiragia]|uniref:Putative membrane protein n=1 Tax=Francisella philomiragia TaxID=28110 RepID=A0A0B6CPF5_9GAMM|nr:hypothetical protein [Francisella philomiragia]AJI52364.1 putative membrane protein [Francisella philomiragia]
MKLINFFRILIMIFSISLFLRNAYIILAYDFPIFSINLAYQIILLSIFIMSIRNVKYFFFIAFVASIYILFSSPTLGLESLKQLYFSVVRVDLLSIIYYLFAWLIPLISFIGCIFKLQEYKKSKNVIK